ncbi:Glycerophosphoryl diester phosphodiesterase [Sphingobacterium spiritivorum]|uniref:Glycerophosphoryl diester phosphodiesterase n=1 Tax=Sphingobacterium spiritivorum TaxID=258 RepID=A0A380BPE5_SPHSI|nr:glycerophosphodiester phosphodiesterase family protein [Sphingobacterium spiritivorum]SUJ03586.1 Glycerophosphoryl diester phosphodiesterase [Sphingobacterium spiritivorum]
MKTYCKLSLTLFLFTCYTISNTFAQKLHTQNYKTVADMYKAFQYAPGKKIISGHRGTIEQGLPENSIPAFEAVLRHAPAIFEIDPRLTKDSIAVLLHDADLERVTNGKGKVSDYTWKDLKKLKLKDHAGNVTPYRINTLDEVIEWAKGKTILNLDKKDLPMEMTAGIIKKHNAYNWVWVTVHHVDQAKFYLEKNPNQYMSMHIKDQSALDKFKSSGLPYNRMIVYIGPEIKEANQQMYAFFHAKGVMCMISTAPTYDKLSSKEARAERYRAVFEDGASILESDRPVEVAQALR